MPFRRDLRSALEAADAADRVALARFGAADLHVETKGDASPVSDADRSAEMAIRSVLGRLHPGDAILGEEYGETAGSARRWIIDPIDATVNFVRGVPVWASLIALEDDDGIAVGVVSAPALGTRWWARRGGGAWHDARRMSVSTTASLGDAHLSINSVTAAEAAGIPGVLALSRACARTRGFGDFWSFMLLAQGAVDAVVEPVAKVWDLAPLIVIVEEAGGRFTDVRGERTIGAGNAVATNGPLHDQVLRVLAG
ncbi:MAG: inositol monophosphatase family protein [Actinomycetota bacterium]